MSAGAFKLNQIKTKTSNKPKWANKWTAKSSKGRNNKYTIIAKR